MKKNPFEENRIRVPWEQKNTVKDAIIGFGVLIAFSGFVGLILILAAKQS